MGNMANDNSSCGASSRVPPGFRFHPTDEELVNYYLCKKVNMEKFDLDVIRDVDLNKLEPWDLHERCRIDASQQAEWYFFSHKDKKYPTGTRTNRATAAGFWKATGRDKAVHSNFKRVGMRKTLVFYRGRAPHGQKTDWIMHEYRLDENSDQHNGTSFGSNEDGWVVCRVFRKRIHHTHSASTSAHQHLAKARRVDAASSFHSHHNANIATSEEDQSSLVDTPTLDYLQQGDHMIGGMARNGASRAFACKEEVEYDEEYDNDQMPFLHLPQLESPKGKETMCLDPMSYNDSAFNVATDDSLHHQDLSTTNHMKYMKRPTSSCLHHCTTSLSFMQEHTNMGTSPLANLNNNVAFNNNSSSCTSTLNNAIFASACVDDDSFMINTSSLNLTEFICPSDQWTHLLENLPKDLRLYHHSNNNSGISDHVFTGISNCLVANADQLPINVPLLNQAPLSRPSSSLTHSQLQDQSLVAGNSDADIWSSFTR
ncbi:hypothetical protein L7F22_067736 [Adiantum nelumboides]|nr:hypothetical protein [Adiantum nelumboides]